MSEDIYVKLGERLNQNPNKFPLIDEVLDFLKDVFTEEQAALAARMPLGDHSLKSLSQLLGRDDTELEKQLESMADEGQIFVATAKNGEKKYSLTPIVPGLIEFQFMRGEETEKVKRRARLVLTMNEALGKKAEKLYQDPELANKKIGNPGLRTLAVEEELPANAEIADWEQITKIMEKEDSFAVGDCACRWEAKFEGHPCKIDGVAMEACVYFGKVADYMIDRKFAKRYSKEELLSLLKACEKQGLIHNINNFLGDNIVLCNCCGCCCNIMRPMIKHRGLKRVANSNFVAVVETETCIGCGECVDICQLKAITMEDETASVRQDYCIGCGNCVSICPSGSLSLMRCASNKPPKQNDKVVGLGL